MFIALVIALATLLPQERTTPSSPLPELVDEVLGALVEAALARDAMQTVQITGQPILDSFETMTAHRRAIRRIEDATRRLKRFAKHKDEGVRQTADAFTTVFQVLDRVLRDGLALDEDLLKVKSEEQLKALIPRSSKIATDAEEAWRMLPLGIAMLTHALVDGDRLLNGKRNYLRITGADRTSMITRIGSLFPNAKPGGGHPVDVSANLLRDFLKGEWRSSDDPRP